MATYNPDNSPNNEYIKIAKNGIRELVNQESPLLNQYVAWMIAAWHEDRFATERDASIAYTEFRVACQIRHWCRTHKHSTAKGAHLFTNWQTNPDLWYILTYEGESDGVRWVTRIADDLRNIYIYFV